MPDDGQSRQLCCEGSLEAGEPLFATASRVDAWLLLEYNAAWGGKALPESGLSDGIKSFLNRQLETILNSRFQFIKQERKSTDRDGIRFYLARSNPADTALYAFDLPTYDALLELDIPAILGDDAGYARNRVDESLFLVCTNGKRDPSCARYGLALYRAMSAYAGAAVWQTIHLGGHRFAGTLACLPEGLYYGRVRPHEVSQFVDEYRAGRIDLDHYRGRSVYDAPVQAAEHFLRQQTGNLNIRGLGLRDGERVGENNWQVTFAAPNGLHSLRVSSHLSDFEIYESTANLEKNRVTIYRMEAYETGIAHPKT